MILNIYKLSPAQSMSLIKLAETDPAKFSMPVNDGRVSKFHFEIEAINTVAKTLAIADARPVDYTALDISEELNEFDAVWVDTEGTLKVKRLILQFDGYESVVTDWKIEPADLDLILHRAGYDADKFCESGDNWEEHRSDLVPAIVAHYLTRAEDENAMPELEKKTALATANGTWAGVDADAYVESVRSGNYEATAITESPDEGQKRYEAAIESLSGIIDKGKIGVWLYIQRALKIAAGIQ